MAQETRFLQTRPDLQKILEEIALLCRSNVAAEDFGRRFLQLTIPAIVGRGAVIWMAQANEFRRAASTNFVETEYETDETQRRSIQAVLRDVAQNLRPVVVGPSVSETRETVITNRTAFPFFYVPAIAGEGGGRSLVAVMQYWTHGNADPRTFKEVVAFLQAAANHAAAFLLSRRSESQTASAEKLQHLLRFVLEMNGQFDTALLAITIVNWGRDIVGCDRCALFGLKPNGKLRALAISNVEVLDERSSLVQSQLRLVQEVVDCKESTLFRKATPKTEALGDISDYFFHSHANEALGIPLFARDGKIIGALLVESHKEQQLDETKRRLAIAVANQSGRALGAARALATIPLIEPLKRVGKLRERLQSDERKKLLMRVGVPVLAALIVAFLPWRFTIQADCRVQPRQRAVVEAEVSGRITEVLVSDGDKVVAGQELARIDDSELQESLLVAEQERAKFEVEANRLEVQRDDSGRRIARINAARVERQISYLKKQIAKSSIRSPIAGVVLTSDLKPLVGNVLQVGSRFCEIGDLEEWEVVLNMKESEVALLDTRLRKNGNLPVEFRLHSMPDRTMVARLRGTSSISQISYQVPEHNVFYVKGDIHIPEEIQRQLKAGYTGRGKIHLGWRPMIYMGTRRFINYMRVRWLF